MKRTVWYVGAGLTLLLLVLAGCAPVWAGDEGASDSSELTVTGNTEYSADEGTTVESASFQFTTSGLSASNTGNTVPVSGQLRAGDILFSLDGAYDPDSGEFSITASGVVVNLRIEISIAGVSNASHGEVSGGTTLVSVVNTETGETTSETDYWADLSLRVVATSTQYHFYNYADCNAAAEEWGLVDEEYYDTGVIVETLSESSTEIVAITYYPNDPVGEQ